MATEHPTYEIHIDTDGIDFDLDTPILSREVHYYDSGIWVDRPEDRLFVPYRRIDAIRELHETETQEPAAAVDAGEPPTDPMED